MRRAHFQQGSLKRVERASGHQVWVFRWRETRADGTRQPRKFVVGPVRELRTETAARQALEALKRNINLDLSESARNPRTLSDLIAHYEAQELAADNTEKSHATKDVNHRFIHGFILDRWAITRWSVSRAASPYTLSNG